MMSATMNTSSSFTTGASSQRPVPAWSSHSLCDRLRRHNSSKQSRRERFEMLLQRRPLRVQAARCSRLTDEKYRAPTSQALFKINVPKWSDYFSTDASGHVSVIPPRPSEEKNICSALPELPRVQTPDRRDSANTSWKCHVYRPKEMKAVQTNTFMPPPVCSRICPVVARVAPRLKHKPPATRPSVSVGSTMPCPDTFCDVSPTSPLCHDEKKAEEISETEPLMDDKSEPVDFEPSPAPFVAPMDDKSKPMDIEPSPAPYTAPQKLPSEIFLETYNGLAFHGVVRPKRKNRASNSRPRFEREGSNVALSFKTTNVTNAWPSTSRHAAVMDDKSEPVDFEPSPTPFAAPMVDQSEPMDFEPSPAPCTAPQRIDDDIILEPLPAQLFRGVLRAKRKICTSYLRPQSEREGPNVGLSFKDTNTMNAWPSTSQNATVMDDESEPMDFKPWPTPFAAPMVKESKPLVFKPSPNPLAAPMVKESKPLVFMPWTPPLAAPMVKESKPLVFMPWTPPLAAPMVKESKPMDFKPSPAPFGAPQSSADILVKPYPTQAFHGVVQDKLYPQPQFENDGPNVSLSFKSKRDGGRRERDRRDCERDGERGERDRSDGERGERDRRDGERGERDRRNGERRNRDRRDRERARTDSQRRDGDRGRDRESLRTDSERGRDRRDGERRNGDRRDRERVRTDSQRRDGERGRDRRDRERGRTDSERRDRERDGRNRERERGRTESKRRDGEKSERRDNERRNDERRERERRDNERRDDERRERRHNERRENERRDDKRRDNERRDNGRRDDGRRDDGRRDDGRRDNERRERRDDGRRDDERRDNERRNGDERERERNDRKRRNSERRGRESDRSAAH